MPFKASHVSFVSFAVEVSVSETIQIIVVETDLHLNSAHPSYDHSAVDGLVAIARDYVRTSMQGRGKARLVSTRGGKA